MSDQTFILILVFTFATIALIALGAASFIRLVALILAAGYKANPQKPDALPDQTPSLIDPDINSSLPHPISSPTTQEPQE